MAAAPRPEKMATALTQDDLTDEQVEELLARATFRLREKPTASKEMARSTLPKLDPGKLDTPYITTTGAIAQLDASRLEDDKSRLRGDGFRKVDAPVTATKLALAKQKATAGKEWYDLPRTDLTPQLKRDLQLIQMRNVLDPHRHYKKDGGKMKAPEYSQVGTIVEGPTDFFAGRIDNKKRKKTFVEEVLSGEQETGRFKRKYSELQDRKTSGKKSFYNALKAKRKGGVKKGGKGAG